MNIGRTNFNYCCILQMHEQIRSAKETLDWDLLFILCFSRHTEPYLMFSFFKKNIIYVLKISTNDDILPPLSKNIEWCYNVTEWEMLEPKLCSKSHTVQELLVLKLNRGHLHLFLQDEKFQGSQWCKRPKGSISLLWTSSAPNLLWNIPLPPTSGAETDLQSHHEHNGVLKLLRYWSEKCSLTVPYLSKVGTPVSFSVFLKSLFGSFQLKCDNNWQRRKIRLQHHCKTFQGKLSTTNLMGNRS